MSNQLKNKKIVIVGGTSGIGLSSARAFIKEGAEVVVLGLDNGPLKNTDNCIFLKGNALETGIIEMVIGKCVSEFGGFDGLMHVAGGSGRKWGDGPLHELTEEGWENTIDLNLKSVMISNRAAVRHFLREKSSGTILNTSSVLADHPSPHFFYTHTYAAAKSGLIGFSKSIAAYYAPYNIRINVISPGLTDTPMAARAVNRGDISAFIKTKQPLDGGRFASTGDIDAAACYFMSDGSGFTTGQVLSIDGGWSVSEGQFHNL